MEDIPCQVTGIHQNPKLGAFGMFGFMLRDVWIHVRSRIVYHRFTEAKVTFSLRFCEKSTLCTTWAEIAATPPRRVEDAGEEVQVAKV